MKRFITILCLISGLVCEAQPFNNEWIDYSKTYYKFPTNRSGLFRIGKSALDSMGLGNTPAEQFKLWRNGQELALYTSAPSGVLPANGYIEFWGQANDGKPDKPLYRDPNYQHTDKLSLQTDTVVYFLTVNPSPGNLRITDVANNVASNSLPVQPYFMYTLGRYFSEQLNPGFAAVIGENVYSSSYDKGEFLSSFDIKPSTPRVDNQSNLFQFNGGPAAQLKFGAVGNALNSRTIQASVNNSLVKDTLCEFFNDVISTSTVPSALLNGGSVDIKFNNNAPATLTDRMVISFYELTYARTFNFGGAANFSFTLPATATGYFLQITNFNNGATAPVLYDFSNQQRYTGDISTPGTVKFAIPASVQQRQLVLVSEDASNIAYASANSFKAKNFVNFSIAANQGNYIIISNPILYNGDNGTNPIADYRAYRNSAAGGSFNANIYEIDELTDQFAFGIKKHPLSVKNFMRFARAKFGVAPQYVLLVGHGVNYRDYRANISNPLVEKLNLVPTFGWPASDNLLSSNDGASPVALTPIGRISAISPQEVAVYLEKVKEYENVQQTAPNTIADRAWMKNIMEVTGASEPYLGSVLCDYMHAYSLLAMDTLLGGNVSIFCKNTSADIEQISNDKVTKLFNDGLSFFCYFGHSSSTVLEFNISDPYAFTNQGRYGFFSVNGCNAGDFFLFDQQRFSTVQTLSEKFTLAKQRGGIAFLASTHFGIVNYLNIFINNMFTLMGGSDYGASLGKINQDAGARLLQISGSGDYHARLHAEQMTLHGDPALKMNFQAKPDYVIEEPQVVINPQFVSVADNKFNTSITIYNLGKYIKDSIVVEVKQQYPDNSTVTLKRVKIAGIAYMDSLLFSVPIVAARDKGLNKLIITIDADNVVNEMSESNNTVTKEFYIYEDEARPIYPYNYAIVNQPSVKLYASTANPLVALKQYAMEMDTTELFNSPLKVSKTISTVGGLIEYDPGVALKDSTVYYWRTAVVPTGTASYHWNVSSFVYLSNSAPGFNQSHYFQHAESTPEAMTLSSLTRTWDFDKTINNIFIRQGVYPTSSGFQADYEGNINSNITLGAGCFYDEIIFYVINPVNFKPWQNVFSATSGLYNSLKATCGVNRQYNFEFLLSSTSSRKDIMDFMDMIPSGYYVVAKTNANPTTNTYSDVWKADTSLYGPGNSLYHRLLNQGFTQIDSFNRPRGWVFVYKKDGTSLFTPKSVFTQGTGDLVTLSADCPVVDTLGYLTSPLFGPAKAWKQVHWRGSSQESPSYDNPSLNVVGVAADGSETVLYTLDKNTQDFDISAVSPSQYPNIRLKMRDIDSINQTPYQLRYWRINYDPVPEGAVIPNVYFKAKDPSKAVDTLDLGEKMTFGLAFKNISATAFDSLRIKMYILDQNNVAHTITLPKKRPLVTGDSVRVDYEIDSKDYPGMNSIYLDFNPDNDQPEQYHFNNFIFRNFYVRVDKTNPLLDVTFDNVHILNNDIVSAKPHIQIKLKDESKFLLLTDTSTMGIQVMGPLPNNTVRTYRFNTDTLRFTPAASGTNNTATIDFSPDLSGQQSDNGDAYYRLIVNGHDASGNKAGATQYSINFRVISKPMISNLLNYPNPFTTSTAFVFTITGSEVPENMKIQILTVTGKVVREITKQELGPLHIGRNITEYKWDGNDQFGQRLGNGVYLYRFVTTLNGKRMDKFTDTGENTDKFFTQGYGKMYLMR